MAKAQGITESKLLLTEGIDSVYFLVWACRAFRPIEDVQIMDFGGVNELPDFLSQLINVEGYDAVETIVIARDAENDADAAVRSVQSAMRQSGLPVPEKAFEYNTTARPKTSFVIFPGPGHSSGTLENLCLMTVQDDPVLTCVDTFLCCAERKGESLPRKHKNKLHCFLAGKDKYVGSTVGQASYKGAWGRDHSALLPFRKVLEAM